RAGSGRCGRHPSGAPLPRGPPARGDRAPAPAPRRPRPSRRPRGPPQDARPARRPRVAARVAARGAAADEPSSAVGRGPWATARRSARLFVTRVLLAPTAVLAHLDPVRIVALRLLCLIVASLALVTRERHGDSHVSPGHCSSVVLGMRRARRKKDPAG